MSGIADGAGAGGTPDGAGPDGGNAGGGGAGGGGGADSGSGGEIRSLTGLRGVAAAYVVLFHFGGDGAGAGPLRAALRHGYLAVDLFFVLSGFVMARTYGGAMAQRSWPGAYGRFLLRRVGRVYPLFLAMTLGCALLSLADPGYEGALAGRTLLSNLLMVQAWGVSYSLDYPGWSISTEFAAYLLFPALAAAMLRGGAAAAAAAGLAVAGLVLVATRSTPELGEAAGRLGPLDAWSAASAYPVLRCLCGFALGMLAWRVCGSAAVRRLGQRPGAAAAVLAAGLVLLAVPGSDVALVLLCGPLLVALSVQERSAAARALSWAPVHWLGVVSYSLYLVHYPVRWAAGTALPDGLGPLGVAHAGAVAGAAEILACVGLAGLTHRWIERPGRDFCRAWPGPRRARSPLPSPGRPGAEVEAPASP